MKLIKLNNYIPLVILLCNFSCGQENPPIIDVPKKISYSYEIFVNDIEIPWGMAFINKSDLLVTEISGTLYRIKNGKKMKVNGLPEIYYRGQGGLLDIALHPSFYENNKIYFTMAANTEGDNKGGNTALYCGELDGNDLKNIKLLYKAKPNSKKGQHWGSRIVFDKNGNVYFGIGDRGNREVNPQDLNRDGGKIYRLKLDGSIPKDNPFINKKGAKKAVFSYGHRNPQGMTIHPITGEIWENEHGPKGGDEINIIKKGINYGWPEITYGVNYSGTPITNKTKNPKMAQPFYYWVPSIAPSGMAFSTSWRHPYN